MLNRVLFVLLLSLSMVSDALAEIKRVAVLEFRGVGIDAPVLLKLSDQSRTAAVEVLSSDEYLIMTRENMLQILGDMGKDASCMDGQCEVTIGRNVGADVIVTGDILQIEGTYVLTLKLYDTLSGGLLYSLDIEDTSVLALKSKTHTQSIALFQKGLKLAPSTNLSTSASTVQRTDSATVQGGGFSLDVVGQANQLAQQIAQLEKVIKEDLDRKEAEIKAKANRQWNSADFVQLRKGGTTASIDTVERFIQAYTNVTVEYPQQVAIPISISLFRTLQIDEVQEARDWMREQLSYKGNDLPQLVDCNRIPTQCVELATAYRDAQQGKERDFTVARLLYDFACEKGDLEGCAQLGRIYVKGQGVEKDSTKALSLFRSTCAKDNQAGCVSLGVMYSTGKGVSQDYGRAVELYKQGCEGGLARGCANLGYMYDIGKGVSQDYGRALELYKQGCEGGEANGCSNLGILYEMGKGVSQDYGRAVELYKQGCEGGNAGGCANLGDMYRYGKGVSQNTSLARKYFRQGCDGGVQLCCDRLSEMD